MMQRIVIVGLTGSGKTTLGEKVEQVLGIPAVDIDVLHWLPNWTPSPLDEFRAKTAEATSGVCWVASGNYSKVRDILWTRADTLVWLDYPFWVSFGRLFKRTMRRIISQEPLWSGNRERFYTQFFTTDSIFLWAWTSYPKQQREYPVLLQQAEYAHLNLVRLKHPREADQWLEQLKTHLEKE